MDQDVLIKAERVSKKFCRSLKRSLWYGVRDMAREVVGGGSGHDVLRQDEFWAIDDVSFELRRGECLGLIGHNGAGKTTLLRLLNGLIKPDRGAITLRGRIGAIIALGAGFNPVLTGRENIYVNGAVLGLSKSEIDEKLAAIVDYAELQDFIDAPVSTYSSGMAVRLGFAIAVNTQPDILLLDEVLAVGDVRFQSKCFNTLARFRATGTAFILVSHNMHQIARYANKAMYLRNGRIVHLGDHRQCIDTFLSDMQDHNGAKDSVEQEPSRPIGSGKLRFIEACFRDRKGRITTSIDTGDPVMLELQYECDHTLERPPLLDIVIRDSESVAYQSTNISAGQPFPPLAAKGRLTVMFDSLPFTSSYIFFYCAAIDPATIEVYDWIRDMRLNIRRTATTSGRIALTTTWAAE